MTTPPHEPERPRPSDLYEPPGSDPFSAFAPPPAQQPPPHPSATRPIGVYEVPEPILAVAPHRESGAGVKIVAVLAVFALALGGLVFWLSTKDTIKFGGGTQTTVAAPTTTTTPPTTTSKAPPFAEVGDCVLMTGTSIQPDYKKVACGEHNYTVSKVGTSTKDKCGEPEDGYLQYLKFSVLESLSVCLVPVFADGQCYDFMMAQLQANAPKKDCGSFGAVRVKVLANTVDKAACGGDPKLALAYPEIKTTYCFSPT
ncbi:LppU/SCO3897 family protein [Lentzea aerocolonigenes]|uniref:LppU/SCO3897 family protein n=1 Tax=Lentzea aerocolonigenes TaxID=68170 RepID=UPI0004C2E3DC|nr:hypothetical protein [Lentzea aerocolonigenes]MCP2242836.1 hypothetical protein [Lentzea aerocolonigenes]